MLNVKKHQLNASDYIQACGSRKRRLNLDYIISYYITPHNESQTEYAVYITQPRSCSHAYQM